MTLIFLGKNKSAMKQQQIWESKWKKLREDSLPPSNFAKRAWKLIKDKNTLLELGCGGGRDSIFFAKKGLQVTAVDFAASALERLKGEQNVEVKRQDISDLRINQRFDVIYANLSLHYFDDRTTRSIFRRLHTLLNKSGFLFVRCKSTDDPLASIGEEIETNFFNIKGKNLHLFDKEYMADMLKDFIILSIRKTTSEHLTMEKGVIKSHFIEAIATKP